MKLTGQPLVPRRHTPPRCVVDGCGRDVVARGWCMMHYQRWRANGDPIARQRAGNGEVLAWLQALLIAGDFGDECLLWPFSLDRKGYGQVNINGRLWRAHHLSLLFVGREVPAPPLEVRHRCGVRRCVNPAHLEPGSRKENAADRLRHGTDHRGEKSPAARLSAEDVRAIRESTELQKVLAARYGVTQQTISKVKRGTRWSSCD